MHSYEISVETNLHLVEECHVGEGKAVEEPVREVSEPQAQFHFRGTVSSKITRSSLILYHRAPV